MPIQTAGLLTIGDIARVVGVPVHRVSYAVDTYGIEPTQRAGILRLFDEEKVENIRLAMTRIAERSGGRL